MYYVASHLDPNCLQRPSKFGSSTERVKKDENIIWKKGGYYTRFFPIVVKQPMTGSIQETDSRACNFTRELAI